MDKNLKNDKYKLYEVLGHIIKCYLIILIKNKKYLVCVHWNCLQLLSLFMCSPKKIRSSRIGALMIAGLFAFVGGCGVDATSSHFSGALRDSSSENKGGFYLDINGDLEGGEGKTILEFIDSFKGNGIAPFFSGDGYPIVPCSDVQSDDPDIWDCENEAWVRIPQKLVDAPSESDLENLTLAIHTLQETANSESIQKLEKFLDDYSQHSRSSNFYKDITGWGLFFVGAQRTIDLVLKHTDIKDMQKLPKFLKFVSNLGLRRSLLHFARARIIAFAAPLIAVGGGGLWWNSHRVRSNMLESVVFKDWGSDAVQMEIDGGVAVYPILRVLLHNHINRSEESSKSSGNENLVVDVTPSTLIKVPIALSIALEFLEKKDIPLFIEEAKRHHNGE